MDWSSFLLDCVVSAAGGCLGAALGALGGFVLFGLLGALGFLYLIFAGNGVWISAVTGSVLLNPGVCFLGGVVATAYARKLDLIRCGKDIGRPFISYRRPDILAVGAAAGVGGYLVVKAFGAVLRGRADAVALTVVLVPLFFKYYWGMRKTMDCEASSHALPSPYRFFEKFSRPRGKTLAALVVGLTTTLVTLWLFSMEATRPYAGSMAFFLSALCLFPLYMGIPFPATHHFSGPAGAATALWLVSRGGLPHGWEIAAVLAWGIAAAQLAMLAETRLGKLFFADGDIHIDPPSMGIVVATAVTLGVLPAFGMYAAGIKTQLAAALPLAAVFVFLNFREKLAGD